MALKHNAATFAKDIRRIQKEMKQDISDMKAWAAITFYSLVASRKFSPVDKGRYIASHQFELTPSANTAPEGLSKSQYVTEAEKTKGEILSYKFDFKSGTFYIANNVAYAEVLEAGRSQQAPSGVYGPAEIEFESMLRKKMAELSKKVYK